MASREQHDRMANAIRFLSMDAVEKANSGHPGLPMGMADVATVLFTKYLKFDARNPKWADRDRFILSAGHGSMLLYSLLYLTGYPDMTIEEIENFRQLGSRTAGHPEYGFAPGIETTTGPLGQGLANSVGFALAERHLNAEFGDELVDHHTYVIAGDGCLMEGVSQEAIGLAGHLRLNKLIVFWDDNSISIDGAVNLSDSTDQCARFAASGWHTIRIDGHDPEAIGRAIEEAKASDRPTLIAAKTIIGYGAPTKAGTKAVHGSALGKEEIAGAREKLNWSYPPFEIPADILDAWREAGVRGASVRETWEGVKSDKRADFDRRMRGELLPDFSKTIADYKRKLAADKPKVATRKSSEMALEVINGYLPETVGGSADLTPSNNTKTSQLHSIKPGEYGNRYIHFGIREFGMAAALNGLTLHGGVIAYGGTFFCFSDYARPAMRLASLMGIRSLFVMTHDSIGLGEDGPTHQPVEHLAAVRAIPNHYVFRPADATEAAESWQKAIESTKTPSTLVLTRQNLRAVREEYVEENLSARGAYELAKAEGGEAKVSIFASGSEVEIAMDAKKILEGEGTPTRVVSVPCFELFEEQDKAYRESVLGNAPVRVGVEAAIRLGWDRFIGSDGAFIGMTGFGASAPAEELYKYFGITAQAVADAARERVRNGVPEGEDARQIPESEPARPHP
ncbi:MAG: transketolase [Methylobacterium mesophilicum]|nr:transketolase [Methylobacterium mesophilicum]